MGKKYKFLITIFIVWYTFFATGNLAYIYAEDAPNPPEATQEASPPPESAPPSTVPEPTNPPEPEVKPTESPEITATPSFIPTPTPAAETETVTDSPSPTEVPSPDPSQLPDPTESPDFQSLNTSPEGETPQATESATPSSSPETTDKVSPDSSATKTESVTQTAETHSETTSESNTGSNTQSGSGSAQMETGNSAATADSVTVANMSEVNSNLITVIETILADENGDINLYQKLIEAIENNPNFVPGDINISVNQTANVTSATNAVSSTGQNSQSAENANMTTGGSAAVSNSVTMVNVNMVGSSAIIAVINILGSYEGNIILPNGLLLTSLPGQLPGLSITANQSGQVTTNTLAISSSGQNIQNTDGTAAMTTGQSQSVANSYSLTNIVQVGGAWAYLIVNNYGNWDGTLNNWDSPGVNSALEQGTYNLLGSFAPDYTNTDSVTSLSVNQDATVETAVKASSATGANSQTAKNTILKTGNSLAIANNFTLANITSVGSSFFMGIINILGDWKGNIISAYPKLEVDITDNKDSLKPGGAQNYNVTLANRGRSVSRNVVLNFLSPNDFLPNGDFEKLIKIGDLKPGEIRTFNFSGRISDTSAKGGMLSAKAYATSDDVQEDNSGMSDEDTTKILDDTAPQPSNPPDSRTPELTASVWTNVGEFIYTGDTIMASITVKNTSSFKARAVKVSAKLVNESGSDVIPLNFDIGDLRTDGKVTASFNLTLKSDLKPGRYTLKAYSTGQAENGNTSDSNTAASSFLVKALGRVLGEVVQTAKAAEPAGITGQILGESVISPGKDSLQERIIRNLPLFALLASAFYTTKKKLKRLIKNSS